MKKLISLISVLSLVFIVGCSSVKPTANPAAEQELEETDTYVPHWFK